MKTIKATEKDSEDLKSFFSQQVTKGVLNHRVLRNGSFFLQYKLVTEDYNTFMIKNSDGQIQAAVSVLFRKGYINHQEQPVAYVTDLTVKPECTPLWAERFIPAIKEEVEKRNCQFVFSDLEQYENETYNMILRRREKSTNLTRYHLFRKFFLVFLFGRKFWRDEPLNSIKIDYGRTEDIEKVCSYLKAKSVGKALTFNINEEELERRFRVWPNFSVQNFLIARNYKNEIIGCMAPWNNKHVQQWVAHKYHGKSFQIYSSVKTLSAFGLMRPLPKEGQAFNVKFLTHYAFDNPDIFYSLIDRAYSDCNNKEIIAYPNYIGDYTTRPPRAFFSVKIPYGFYTLLDSSEKLPEFLHPNPFTPPPDFPYVHF